MNNKVKSCYSSHSSPFSKKGWQTAGLTGYCKNGLGKYPVLLESAVHPFSFEKGNEKHFKVPLLAKRGGSARFRAETGYLSISSLFFTFYFLLFTSSISWAYNAGGAGSTSAQMYKITQGARAAGMGGIYPQVASGVLSIYHNPAGLSGIRSKEIHFSNVLWPEGINYLWTGFTLPFRTGSSGNIFKPENVLYVDRFDSDINLIGGASGQYADDNSSISGEYISQSENRLLKLMASVAPGKKGASAGYWFGLNGLNIAGKDYLYFKLKAGAGMGKIMVAMKDKKSYEARVNLSDYIDSAAWTKVLIPLDDFIGIDKTAMDNVSVSFSGDGELLMDDLAFISGAGKPLTLGFSFGYLSAGVMDRIEEISDPPYYLASGSFNPYALSPGLSAGREINVAGVPIPVGLTLKYYREDIDSNIIQGILADIGTVIIRRVGEGYARSGIVFSNYGYLVQGRQEKISPPETVNFGASYTAHADKFLTGINLSFYNDMPAVFSVGGEYRAGNNIVFRSGYSLGRSAGGLALGVGFIFSRLNIDYAFCPMDLLGFAHRISLEIKFKK